MANKSRKTRTDSTANLLRIFAGSNVEIAPPAHIPLDDVDFPYWHSLVDEFAKADWTPHSLDMASFLARTMAELEEQQRLMFEEGPVIVKTDGSPGPNPRNRVVANLVGQALAMRRSLGLTARAKAGSTRNAARQREANRVTELRAIGNHDLLA